MRRSTAVLLLCLASSAGVVAAANFEAAAVTYQNGDYETAFRQFMPLAKSGDARAQTVIAMMYKYGEAVDQSWPSAFEWYLKAAEAGYVPAQFQVGDMYAEGLGVDRDRERAVHWLTLAAEGGFAKANEKLGELEAELVPMEEEPEELIAWSKAWKLHLPRELQRLPPEPPPIGRDSPASQALYRVQLGAMKSLDGAHALWNRINARTGSLFDGMEPFYRRRESASGTLYAVQTGPFPNKLAATRFCEELAARGVTSGCLPLRSTGAAE